MIITILLAGLLLILAAGIRCGFALDDLIRMAVNGIKKAVNVLSVLAIVGILTAMWRADGTIAYIVSSAAGLFKPSILIVTIFLMNCLVSFMTGTSFGTAATMGVISMTIAGTAGVNPVISGGAVISGCFFGDRCSPLSSSAILVASVTETNLFDNIRNMLRTAAVPFVLTCLIYGAIGLCGINQVDAASVSDVFAKEFQLNRWMILPAVIVLGLSMLRVDVKQSMTLSIVCAVILCVVFQISSGNYPDHADRIQGRGSGGCADDQWRWPAIDEEGFDDCLYDIYLFRDFQWHRNAGWHNGICKNNLSKDGKIFMYRAAFCCYKYGRLQSDNRNHDDRAAGLCFV